MQIQDGKHVIKYGEGIYGEIKYGQYIYDVPVNVGEIITAETEYLEHCKVELTSARFSLNGGIVLKECEVNLIYNRTAADVETAKTLRAKVQSGQELAPTELTAIERGSCTITMLNRVENKQAELAVILSGYAYMVHIESKTDWQNTDIFTFQDHQEAIK